VGWVKKYPGQSRVSPLFTAVQKYMLITNIDNDGEDNEKWCKQTNAGKPGTAQGSLSRGR